jgi:BASS family bile acid:Na+ symporter
MELKHLLMPFLQLSLIMIVTSVGLLARWRDVRDVMRNVPLLGRAVIAVNIVVPVTAVIMCTLLPMDKPIKIGIVLMAVSPLAPVLSARLTKAGVETATAVGIDFALAILAVIIVPLTLELLSAIFPATTASISVSDVGKLVTIAILAPLAIGMAIHAASEAFARHLSRILLIAGVVGVLIGALVIVYMRIGAVLGLVGDGTLLAIATTIAAGIAAGHFLGGPEPLTRLTVALAAGLRFPGLAALIAKQNFREPDVIMTIALYLLTAVVLSLAYQVWVLKRAHRSEAPQFG